MHCKKCEAYLTPDQRTMNQMTGHLFQVGLDKFCDMCWPYRHIKLTKKQIEGDERYCTVCGDGDLEEYYIFPDCNPGMDYFCNDHEPKNMTFMNTTDTYPQYDPARDLWGHRRCIVRIDEWSILIPTFQQMYDYSEEQGGDLAYWTTRD